MTTKTVIAQCIAESGYGTSYYDEETNECEHRAYGYLQEVLVNPEYWKQYDGLSEAMHRDFDMPWGFDRCKLTVYSDGSTTCEEVHP